MVVGTVWYSWVLKITVSFALDVSIRYLQITLQRSLNLVTYFDHSRKISVRYLRLKVLLRELY